MGSRAMVLGGALAAALLVGCGGSSHKTSTTRSVATSAPASTGAAASAIETHLLTTSELPAGFSRQGGPMVATSAQQSAQQLQGPGVSVSSETARLKRLGFVAGATQNLNSANGPGISSAEQFRSAAGARSELANNVALARSNGSSTSFAVPGIPGAAGFGGPGPNGGVNVAFVDGNYVYVVGEQPSAPANRAGVIASAQKLYRRVHG